MKINAKPGTAIIPVRAESCGECVFHNGVYCAISHEDRDCSDFGGGFGGYVFKAVNVSQINPRKDAVRGKR